MTSSYQSAVTASSDGTPPAEGDPPSSMKRVASASFVGTVIEFYDFGIYGAAAALVFPQVFFPALGPAAGTIASFAALGTAFVARPFGSILFGHLGDRLGRKRTLIATMMTMGLATVLVGLMPTAAQIGVAAPVLLVVLRIMQGLAAGGEWAGAVLFSSESAPAGQRGFWAMFPSLGGAVSLILANGTFLLTSLVMSPDAFMSWGWRVPFIASILLVMFGLWVRLSVDETPVFKTMVVDRGTSPVPLVEAYKSQRREVLLATGISMIAFTLLYIGNTYLVSYGTSILELPRTFVLLIAMLGGAAMGTGIVVGAVLSDRFGRRRILMIMSWVAIAWSLALFPIIGRGSEAAFSLGLPLTTLVAGLAAGPLGALLSETFNTQYRYTAAGLSYSLAGMLGGGIPPLIAVPIVANLGGPAFGMILAAVCFVTFLCTLAIPETTGRDLIPDVAVPSRRNHGA